MTDIQPERAHPNAQRLARDAEHLRRIAVIAVREVEGHREQHAIDLAVSVGGHIVGAGNEALADESREIEPEKTMYDKFIARLGGR